MITNYQKELIQVAAVAVAALQCDLRGSTDIFLSEQRDYLAKLLNFVSQERQRQEAKWGPQFHSPEKWMTILMEEVGETAREVLETKCPTKT